jgi:hypothetical protein
VAEATGVLGVVPVKWRTLNPADAEVMRKGDG